MRAALRVTNLSDDAAPGRLIDAHKTLMVKVATNRDREAFGALFAYFGPRVKALMLKAGADHALAEDLVQDVMMTVWRKVELYAPDRGTVSTWVYTIARNARIDRLRRNSSRPYDDIDELELASGDKNAEEETFSGQQAERIAIALAELPEEQREIIELSYMHDMAQSGIAAKLGLPLGTVKSRMRLAYGKLKAKLEDLT
jgi:RNA polymerase sigma-70 factor (ECF subfamily)